MCPGWFSFQTNRGWGCDVCKQVDFLQAILEHRSVFCGSGWDVWQSSTGRNTPKDMVQPRAPKGKDEQTYPPHQRAAFGRMGEGEGAHPAFIFFFYLLMTETIGKLIPWHSLGTFFCPKLEVAVATGLGETLCFSYLFTRSWMFQVGHQNEIYYLHRSLERLNSHHSTVSRQFKTNSKPESPPKPGLW